VRPLGRDEGRLYLEIVNRAIRGLAAGHYPREVVEAWVPPVTDEAVQWLMLNPEDEIRLVAELDGAPAGIGALVLRDSELRACYVTPEAARHGCGTALVREIERLARANGLTYLQLVASINAEPFYAVNGYEGRGRVEHVLRNGQRMAAVKMFKKLTS